MARQTFNLNSSAMTRLFELLKNTKGNAEEAINDVLWNEAGTLISDEIISLLPVSGRTWRGKKKSAKYAQPFLQSNDNLSVTVKTKNAYHYLYFPDDGTTTRKHAGEKHFMYGGAEHKQDEIIERCIAKITENFKI